MSHRVPVKKFGGYVSKAMSGKLRFTAEAKVAAVPTVIRATLSMMTNCWYPIRPLQGNGTQQKMAI
jgi:hypothetical protein